MRTPRHFNTRSLPILRPTFHISATLGSSEGLSDQMENALLFALWPLSIGAVACDWELPRWLTGCGFFTTARLT
jgi:hypothetical protein